MSRKKKWIVAAIILLAAAWGIRVVYVTNYWRSLFPTHYFDVSDTVEECGFEIRIKDYFWTDLSTLEATYGEIPQEEKETYRDVFLEDHDYRFLQVNFEFRNLNEKTTTCTIYDAMVSGDYWAANGFYTFVNLCNNGDSYAARTLAPGETGYYTHIYVLGPKDIPRYIVFGNEGGLKKIVLPEDLEVRDGEIVEA